MALRLLIPVSSQNFCHFFRFFIASWKCLLIMIEFLDLIIFFFESSLRLLSMMWLMKGITLLSRHVGEGNITLMIVLKNFWLADISPELAKFLPMYFQEAIPSISILCNKEPANISGVTKNSFKSSNSSDLKQDLAISGFDFEPLAWISNPLLMSISQRNIWASFLSAVIQICLSQIIFPIASNQLHTC